jgi:hypothetical protein
MNNIKYLRQNIIYEGETCEKVQELSSCESCVNFGSNLFITTTTTPQPSICWQNGKNPCNYGSCSISSVSKYGYLCFCPPDVKGN